MPPRCSHVQSLRNVRNDPRNVGGQTFRSFRPLLAGLPDYLRNVRNVSHPPHVRAYVRVPMHAWGYSKHSVHSGGSKKTIKNTGLCSGMFKPNIPEHSETFREGGGAHVLGD